MKNPLVFVAAAGAVAVFFAVVLNLATGADALATQQLAIESAVAAVIAIGCGVFMVTRGGSWKFYAIALIGPGLFVLMDAGVRLAMALKA